MGAVKNGSKFNGVAIGGVIVNGFAKGGQVVYKKEQFDISTKAVFDFATTQGYTLPSNKNAFDTLIRDMKSIGIWDLLDNFYLFTGDGGNNFKRINLINPNKYLATYFGGLEITTNEVKGNGVNAYIDTNFNPSLLESGQKYQQNNALIGGINTDIPTVVPFTFTTANGTNFNQFGAANTNAWRINSIGTNNLNASVNTSSIGLKVIQRISSNDVEIISNNLIHSRTQTGGNIANASQVILKSGGALFYTGKLQTFFMGSSISFEISQNFRTIFNKYLSSIGLTPIA